MKNNIFLILCFLGIVLSIVSSIIIFFVVEGLLALRIIILVLALFISVFLFILSNKFRKKVIVTEEDKEVEVKVTRFSSDKLRCPKCHKPYDGDTCFYCGFRR